MKFNFDIKNKKIGLEANVEDIVKNGLDQHEKSFLPKFNLKKEKKKELKELDHKQKIEFEELKQKRLNWYQKMQEEKRKNKELKFKIAMKFLAIWLGIMLFFIILAIVCSIFET